MYMNAFLVDLDDDYDDQPRERFPRVKAKKVTREEAHAREELRERASVKVAIMRGDGPALIKLINNPNMILGSRKESCLIAAIRAKGPTLMCMEDIIALGCDPRLTDIDGKHAFDYAREEPGMSQVLHQWYHAHHASNPDFIAFVDEQLTLAPIYDLGEDA